MPPKFFYNPGPPAPCRGTIALARTSWPLFFKIKFLLVIAGCEWFFLDHGSVCDVVILAHLSREVKIVETLKGAMFVSIGDVTGEKINLGSGHIDLCFEIRA